MIKIYCKTTTINAEQFDGSNEMAKRYGAELYSESGYGYDAVEGEPDGDGYVLITPESESLVRTDDWIATGVNGEHWVISDDVFKRTYKELPVIPHYVAEYIADMKSQGDDIWDATHHFIRDDNLAEYMEDNSGTFARAWLDGYQMEED